MAVELDNVASYLLVVRHGQPLDAILCIADGIMGPEVGREFLNELRVVVHPTGAVMGVVTKEELGFEPIEGGALKERLSIDDL